ncbi:cyclin [Purpureocillium lavendulum]|uniref:Cyclin n=1 Tax=Purpureocillium lavendulum TaxID=1247861 RepID=A0AB34FJ72_9HYPO|nr:cyclin [Purpureocillium lavendulum]
MDELNKVAMEQLIHRLVSREMILYLADVVQNIFTCDSSIVPQVSSKNGESLSEPARSTVSQSVQAVNDSLPSMEDFITQLVVCSNVQVPTLMSTLVYFNRLKSKLRCTSPGLNCTAHRIFLATLIVAAKYLNDKSPKNRHWAKYTQINTETYQFGLNLTEVNLMERQLLFLLEWKLRITENDLYAALDCFLEPLRMNIIEKHVSRWCRAPYQPCPVQSQLEPTRQSEACPSRHIPFYCALHLCLPESFGSYSSYNTSSCQWSRSTPPNLIPRHSRMMCTRTIQRFINAYFGVILTIVARP